MTREETIASLRFFSRTNDKNIDWERVDLSALVCLDNARAIAKTAIFVTSNYRTPEESVIIGGLKDDAHTEIPCAAFDISCTRPDGSWDSQKAYNLVPALIISGFKRLGIGKKHIHADRSPNLPAGVIWLE